MIDKLFTITGYTYGPLLGLYSFGQITSRKVTNILTPFIEVLSLLLCYFLSKFSVVLFIGYKFGFELLLVNGLLTFPGLLTFNKGSRRVNV